MKDRIERIEITPDINGIKVIVNSSFRFSQLHTIMNYLWSLSKEHTGAEEDNKELLIEDNKEVSELVVPIKHAFGSEQKGSKRGRKRKWCDLDKAILSVFNEDANKQMQSKEIHQKVILIEGYESMPLGTITFYLHKMLVDQQLIVRGKN